MDIGNLKNNNQYYAGYEGEPEIILTIPESPEYCIHVWEGYLDDLLENPPAHGGEWVGFTRDYQLMQGIFSNENPAITIDSTEYMSDLKSYVGGDFRYEETADVLTLILALLTYAVETGRHVQAEIM